MRLLRAGDDEEPGGVAVEPVDDPRAVLLPTPGPPDETVDERSAAVARSRVHDDPGRLVDDEQVLVLVGDAEVDLLALERPSAPPAAARPRALLRPRADSSSAARSRRRAPSRPRRGARLPSASRSPAARRGTGRGGRPPPPQERGRGTSGTGRGRVCVRCGSSSAARRMRTPRTMKQSARLKAGQ